MRFWLASSSKSYLRPRFAITLEHFDEYIDATDIRCYQRQISLPALLPLDFSMGHRRSLEQFQDEKGSTYSVRVYLSDERVFVNCGREINIGQIYEECCAIRDRLWPLVPHDEGGEQGSYIIVLTPESFD